MEHECVIGLLYRCDGGELATLDGLKEHIQENMRLAPLRSGYGIDSKVYMPSDYADKRKSTDLCRYDYCPFCGKKIDWKAIKKMKVED